MAGRGHRVFLLCHPDGVLFKKAEKVQNITAIPLAIGRLSFLNPMSGWRLERFFHQEGVDALVMNLPQDMKCAAPSAKRAGVRHIIYRRGSALPVKNSAMNRLLYGRILTGLIVNSRATLEATLRNNRNLIPEERITLLPNGLDIARFDQALEAGGATLLPGKQHPLVLGTAGRLNRQKAQHLFLHLGNILREGGLDCHLVLAGTGELEGKLRELARRLGLEGHVTFTGFLDDLSPFWRTVDIFVLPSLWEGFGFVLLEAMLARKPVVAFGISNIPELVQHGHNGLLFPLTDVATPDMTPMAEGVATLARDTGLCSRMGEAGREFAVSHFDQEGCMDRLELLLAL